MISIEIQRFMKVALSEWLRSTTGDAMLIMCHISSTISNINTFEVLVIIWNPYYKPMFIGHISNILKGYIQLKKSHEW
jgi:hypothetical protein